MFEVPRPGHSGSQAWSRLGEGSSPCQQQSVPALRSHSGPGRESAPGWWCKRGIGKGPGAPGPFYGCPVLRARTAMGEKGSQQDPK